MAYTLQQIFILPVTNPHGASISIHAPAKGATVSASLSTCAFSLFQSTHP